ncbi:MAG: hypothetical protein O3A21_01835, partial [Proteobacteria bacterium]|nr:hypothetical protein [Pseudomonadota bacterium]
MNEQTRCNTLHDALDTYEEMLTHETDAGVTSMATLHSRQLMVRRLKKYHEDMPISEITLDVCVAMIGYWRDRPASATTGKPIA